MKPKPSIWFLVSAMVAVLLIAGAAVLLFAGKKRERAVETELEARRQALSLGYERDPFPSAKNVEQEKASAAHLMQWYTNLVAQAGKGQLNIDERRPPVFMTQLGEAKRGLIAKAKTPERFPAEFAFGFDRYLGEGSKLPSPEHVPRLIHQLRVVETLCQILLDENVAGIQSVEREGFEGAVSTESGNATEPMSNADAGLIGEGALYGHFHFRLAFTATESALLGVLNHIAQHDLFMTVTRVDCRKQGEDVTPMEDIRKSLEPAGGAPGTEAVAAMPAPMIVAEPLSREQRIVCGVPVEAPMQVKMELDVYHFRKEGE